jgi:hypothetical protein
MVKIKEKFKTPIFVGGLALAGKDHAGFDATEAQNWSMSELARILVTL